MACSSWFAGSHGQATGVQWQPSMRRSGPDAYCMTILMSPLKACPYPSWAHRNGAESRMHHGLQDLAGEVARLRVESDYLVKFLDGLEKLSGPGRKSVGG